MKIKNLHYISGLVISIFIGFHLFNHFYAIFGVERHIELMDFLRKFYRNPFLEAVLLCSIFVQIVSGIKLIKASKAKTSFFNQLHIWTGIYLAFFLVIHVSAVFIGRFSNYDTNFYYGAIAINTFPFSLFFVPYYTLAIMSFFGHIASVHLKKMKYAIFGLSPKSQSVFILVIGALITGLIFFGATNHFKGVEFPEEYKKLVTW